MLTKAKLTACNSALARSDVEGVSVERPPLGLTGVEQREDDADSYE